MNFVKRHAILCLALAFALVLTGAFLVQFTVSVAHWSDPASIDQPIAGWMTPRYVARSWDVPAEVVAGALGIERDGSGRRTTLSEIAARQGRNVDDLISELDVAIRTSRAGSDG